MLNIDWDFYNFNIGLGIDFDFNEYSKFIPKSISNPEQITGNINLPLNNLIMVIS